ncbi:MAG: MarR family transcriptional regulator [Ferruginibacter sp.]
MPNIERNMGIEKDISQENFRNDYQKAVINFIYTWHWLNEKMRGMFEKEGITSQQYNILRILRGAAKPISTLQIRQRMLDKMSDSSRLVDRLLSKDLVKKNICPSDRRLVDVSITDKGKKLLEKMDKYDVQLDALFVNLDENEIKQLNQLLDKIRTNPND